MERKTQTHLRNFYSSEHKLSSHMYGGGNVTTRTSEHVSIGMEYEYLGLFYMIPHVFVCM